MKLSEMQKQIFAKALVRMCQFGFMSIGDNEKYSVNTLFFGTSMVNSILAFINDKNTLCSKFDIKDHLNQIFNCSVEKIISHNVTFVILDDLVQDEVLIQRNNLYTTNKFEEC
jgi:hypothetical protein